DILFYIGCGNEEEDWVKQSKKIIKEAMSKGYEKMMATHCEWWKNFWDKSSISLPDKMFEKQWYLTNYLFGSCSRKGAPPMPLQDVWTADEGKKEEYPVCIIDHLHLRLICVQQMHCRKCF
ncbi:MAG: hypothetical protein MJA84_16595, partial [Firmicutes bacterium]|nr:hypothetical protein [Bacillota bacterium]